MSNGNFFAVIKRVDIHCEIPAAPLPNSISELHNPIVCCCDFNMLSIYVECYFSVVDIDIKFVNLVKKVIRIQSASCYRLQLIHALTEKIF